MGVWEFSPVVCALNLAIFTAARRSLSRYKQANYFRPTQVLMAFSENDYDYESIVFEVNILFKISPYYIYIDKHEKRHWLLSFVISS